MTSDLTPLISIVIPTYEMKDQGVFFLERCLDSIKKQVGVAKKSIEVVISDQSSNEAIEQYLKILAINFPFEINYHRTSTKKGIAAHNLNIGILYGKGQYIKILFQDDLLIQDHYLKSLMEIIQNKFPDCILTAAAHTRNGVDFFDVIIPSDNSYFLFGNNTVSSPSVLTVKKSIFENLPFDEALKLLFDCDFYYRLFSRNPNIEVCESISIANGIWDGQTQFAISRAQFTQEVRYLNWKYPSANLTGNISAYKRYFSELHPTAPFPFDENLKPSIWQKLWWGISRN
jgi:glycosyltransferase involved in cell wall biosynthesis